VPKVTPVRVIAAKSGLVCPEPVRFDSGARDVHIVLESEAAISGSFRAATMSGHKPSVTLKRLPIPGEMRVPPPPMANGTSARVAPDGSWTAKVEPGPYDVEIRVPGVRGALLLVEGLVVPHAKDVRDSRLQDLDLDALVASIHHLAITVTDPSGLR